MRLEAEGTATCPAGKVVIGGGVEDESNFPERRTGVLASRPAGTDAWYGKARTYEPATGVNLAVYAVCARVQE